MGSNKVLVKRVRAGVTDRNLEAKPFKILKGGKRIAHGKAEIGNMRAIYLILEYLQRVGVCGKEGKDMRALRRVARGEYRKRMKTMEVGMEKAAFP